MIAFEDMPTVRVGDFEWDSAKAIDNAHKHGVTFEEGMTAFLDELGVPFQDVAHPERLILLAESSVGRLLLVVFTERVPSGMIRVVSVRRANKRERRVYEEER